MNAKTRRAALEAASRVALGALSLSSLASCGGKTMDGGEFEPEPAGVGGVGLPQPAPIACASVAPGPPPPPPMDAGTRPPPSPADAGSTLACIGPVSVSLGHPETRTISEEAFGCCLSYVLRYGADDGTASYANCCAAVVVGVDQDPTRWQVGGEAWAPCCQSDDPNRQADLQGHVMCTPWGPPVPPSLPAELGGVA